MVSVTPDDLVAMALFVRVVEERSFTAAAREVGISKSVVSSRIARLEERLGARLLHRTTRRVALTTDGVRVYERCARVLAEASEVTESLAGSTTAPRGLLRVSAPSAFASRYLASPIATFLKRFPQVRVELSLEARPGDPLAEGVDVAIRVASRLDDSSLLVRRLAADRLLLCAAPSYLRVRGIPWRPEDLVHHDVVARRGPAPLRFRTAEGPLDFGGAAPIAADDDGFVREAAVGGLGIAALPVSLVADGLDDGSLFPVLEGDVEGELFVAALTPHVRPVPAKVRAFVDLLVSEWRSPPWSAALDRGGPGKRGDEAPRRGRAAERPRRRSAPKAGVRAARASDLGARTITHQDVFRLGTVADLFEAVDPVSTAHLRTTLAAARAVPSEKVSPEVVTMNARVVCHEANGDTREITVVYPWDAASESGRVSVLSPLGAALLGRAVGDAASLASGHGAARTLTLQRIAYQPEVAGDHHL